MSVAIAKKSISKNTILKKTIEITNDNDNDNDNEDASDNAGDTCDDDE